MDEFITKEFLANLIEQHQGDNLAAAIEAAIKERRQVQDGRRQLRQLEWQEQARHKDALADLGRKWKELRSTCRHPKTTYLPSPCGGSDSRIPSATIAERHGTG